jgi:hypothetical protein
MRSGPPILRERNFRLLFAARTTSFFGTNLAPIAVAFAVIGAAWIVVTTAAVLCVPDIRDFRSHERLEHAVPASAAL